MIRRIAFIALGLVFVATGMTTVPAAGAPAACDPFLTNPSYDGTTPTDEQVLGFALGSQEVSVHQSDLFLSAVDSASDRVVTGTAAVSVGGRALRYAIVGSPDRLTPQALADIRAGAAALRDPLLPASEVSDLVAATPTILWVSGNVHGTEESGADASLKVLFELADRSDCVVQSILDDSIVVILPIQNPDGRQAETRRNLYGFDMNRDWFARTQPETDGKLALLRRYPPMLNIDAHEFGSPNYLFPPTADPEYHETPDLVHDWIFDEYSPAIAGEFDREGLRYHHGAPYDFFASIFGDTVPAVGFHAAGMTFEKNDGDPIADRVHQQFIAMWASLFEGSSNAEQRVADWHGSYVEAYQEGLAGTLEPNEVFEPKHSVYQPVPDDLVRSYFLLNDARRATELQLLTRRLQRMDVDVYQLTAPVTVGDYHPYAAAARQRTFPTGTYWIPLAQGQKHWIQSMLHEDSYIPFDVTYDVTAWSNPLLMNLRGGWTGADLSPEVQLVERAREPAPPILDPDAPRVGLFEIPNSTRGFEAAGQARYLFDQVWELPYKEVTAQKIINGLRGVDVLVVPDGYTNYALQALGAKGKKALREWVNAGGRYVGWQGGVEVAVRSGISTVKLSASHTNAPGTLIRVAVDRDSPLAAGLGSSDWVMYSDDNLMATDDAVATYPAPGSRRFGTAGLAQNIDQLTGSAALADEAVGLGRVISFAVDPNFRAWTQGTQRLLWNAITEPIATTTRALPAGATDRAHAERRARAAAAALPHLGSAIRIAVAKADAQATTEVLQTFTTKFVRERLHAGPLFLVENRHDWSMEEHPYFAQLLVELRANGINVRWASIP